MGLPCRVVVYGVRPRAGLAATHVPLLSGVVIFTGVLACWESKLKKSPLECRTGVRICARPGGGRPILNWSSVDVPVTSWVEIRLAACCDSTQGENNVSTLIC